MKCKCNEPWAIDGEAFRETRWDDYLSQAEEVTPYEGGGLYGEEELWFRLYWTDEYGATSGDEILIRSNAAEILSIFEAYGLDDYSERGMLAGSGIDVPVYRDHDPRKGFTREFMVACLIRARLDDYPILDEADYSEREWRLNEETFRDELRFVGRDYVDDDDADVDEIVNKAGERLMRDYSGYWSPGDYDPQVIREVYVEERDALYVERGQEFLAAQIPGQDALAF